MSEVQRLFLACVLEQNSNAMCDFNMIDATTGLPVERGDREGIADKLVGRADAARTAFRISPGCERRTQ
jgi:hypothetical protein